MGEHARALAPTLGLPKILHGVFAGKVRDKVRSALVAAHPGAEARFVVQITGAKNLFLKGGRGGKEVPADREGQVSTIITAREGGDGSREVELGGPHLISADSTSPPQLELWEKRFLRRSRRVARVAVAGEPQAWLRRSKYSGVPVVTIRLNGDTGVTVTPERLEETPFRWPD